MTLAEKEFFVVDNTPGNPKYNGCL